MLGNLTEKLRDLASRLSTKKTLTEDNIAEAVKEVRLALLDADVNFSIVSQIIRKVKEKAVGERMLKAVSAGSQFIEIVHEELTTIMGEEAAFFETQGSPCVIMLCGLQGSGKTTTAAKLALHLQKKPYAKKVLVAACDLFRLAAKEQLKTLCLPIGIEVFSLEESVPAVIAQKALEKAKKEGFDVLIIDTAGRLHIDEELMHELADIKKAVLPHEILFVASAHTGQEAASTAKAFNDKMAITGTILTMLDGTSRAGAAISIREITQKPLKFEGIGEKIEDFQSFNPKSMADRILGMGDIVNLVRKAKEQFGEDEEKEIEAKLLKASFTYDDYLKQMSKIRKMGSLKSLLQMIPGIPKMPELDGSEKQLGKIEAVILSMTPSERNGRVELVPSRRWRIAKGSGTSIDEVNRLIKGFKKMKELMKTLPKKPLQNPSSLKKFNDFWG